MLHSHFAGDWSGYNKELEKKPPLTNSLRIHTTVDVKHHQLHLEYTYIDGNTGLVDTQTTLIRIDVASEKMFRDRKEIGKDEFHVEGLAEMLRTGYGTFAITAPARKRKGKLFAYRAEYHLSLNAFAYEVYNSKDGGPFVRLAEWSTERDGTAPVDFE